jgi:hypothetical protein
LINKPVNHKQKDKNLINLNLKEINFTEKITIKLNDDENLNYEKNGTLEERSERRLNRLWFESE